MSKFPCNILTNSTRQYWHWTAGKNDVVSLGIQPCIKNMYTDRFSLDAITALSFFSALWHCWFGNRKGFQPVNSYSYYSAGYASQHIWCLSQARIKWEGCCKKGIRHQKMPGDGGGSLIRPDGVTPSWMVGVSASVIFPCKQNPERVSSTSLWVFKMWRRKINLAPTHWHRFTCH